jgi:hypothetical protein
MGLKIEDLGKVEREFPEFYIDIFHSSLTRLKHTLKIKNQVIKKIEDEDDSSSVMTEQVTDRSKISKIEKQIIQKKKFSKD